GDLFRFARLAETVAAVAGAFVLSVTPAAALDNGLARTPPVGWNSWYTARCGVTEGVVLRNAHALVDSGLAGLGYRYVNVDGCWLPAKTDPRKIYSRVARAAREAGRPMLVTVSTPGVDKPWEWASAYGNTWRISADANGTWKGVTRSLDVDAPLYPYAG